MSSREPGLQDEEEFRPAAGFDHLRAVVIEARALLVAVDRHEQSFGLISQMVAEGLNAGPIGLRRTPRSALEAIGRLVELEASAREDRTR